MRCYPPQPESGEVPKDEEPGEHVEEVSEPEASEDGEETEDDDFLLAPRNRQPMI